MKKCPKCGSELHIGDVNWQERDYIYILFSCSSCDTYYDSKVEIDKLKLVEVEDGD